MFLPFLQQATASQSPTLDLPQSVQGALIVLILFASREIPSRFITYLDLRIQERKKRVDALQTANEQIDKLFKRIDTLEGRADNADDRADKADKRAYEADSRAKTAVETANEALDKHTRSEAKVAELEGNLQEMNKRLETLMTENIGKETIILQQKEIIQTLEQKNSVLQDELEEVKRQRDYYKDENARLISKYETPLPGTLHTILIVAPEAEKPAEPPPDDPPSSSSLPGLPLS